MRKLILTIVLAASAFAAVAVPADACACEPPGKNAARWQLEGGEQLDVTANRHATVRSARAVGNAWLDTSTWSPGTLNAGDKRWYKAGSRKYGNYARTLIYVHGRQLVTLYWSKYGAG
jgi:Ni/Co efflux regulator RcnB